MSEDVLIALIGVLGILLGGGVVAMWKAPKEARVLDSQQTSNISMALKNAIDSFTDLQAAYSQLEKRVNEIEADRNERGRFVFKLQQDIEKLNREYTAQVASLQDKVRQLEQQVDAERQKNIEYKSVLEVVIEAVRKVDPTLLDGINLPDTLNKIKAVKK